MEKIIIDIINNFGYIGIAFLVAIENIFPPIPSELILSFGGFLTTYTHLNVFGVVVSSTIGSVIGALILYMIGKKISKERLEKIIDGKIGKILRLKKEDINKTNKWFIKHGNKAVFFGRFVPIIRSLISVPAGASKMKLRVFLPLTVLGSAIWNTLLVSLGAMAKDAWQSVSNNFNIYSTIVGIILIIIGIIFVSVFFIKRNSDNKKVLD